MISALKSKTMISVPVIFIVVLCSFNFAQLAPAAAQLTPQRGGTLTVGWYNDVASYMGILDIFAEVGAPLAQIYNKLLVNARSSQGQIFYQGDLASSWENTLTPEGGQTIRFHLYNNVTWHDGVPFTADDVKFSYLYAMNYSQRQIYAIFVRRYQLKSINVVDPYTVDFVFAKIITLDRFIGQNQLFIYPKHIWEGTDPAKNTHRYTAPVGTGPYIFKEWVPNVYSRYVRNPNYFHKGRPYLDEVVFKVIPTPQGRALALQSKEINMGAILPDQVDSFKQDFTLGVVGQGASWRMRFNFNESWVGKSGKAPAPWVLDVKVREAFSHALNAYAINTALNHNLSIVVPGPIDPRSIYFNPKVWDIYKQQYGYDSKLSEQLLDQAGWPRKSDGTRFSFDMPSYSSAEYFVPTIVAQLKAVGIDAKPLYIDDAAFASQIEISLDGMNKYPVIIQTDNMGTYQDPGSFSWFFHDRGAANGVLNCGFYNNPEVENNWNLANSQVDPQKRMPYFYKGQELMMNDHPFYFIFEPIFPFAWARGIHGYESFLQFQSNHLDTEWIEQGTTAVTSTTATTGTTTPNLSFDPTTLSVAAIAIAIVIGIVLTLKRRTKKPQ